MLTSNLEDMSVNFSPILPSQAKATGISTIDLSAEIYIELFEVCDSPHGFRIKQRKKKLEKKKRDKAVYALCW